MTTKSASLVAAAIMAASLSCPSAFPSHKPKPERRRIAGRCYTCRKKTYDCRCRAPVANNPA